MYIWVLVLGKCLVHLLIFTFWCMFWCVILLDVVYPLLMLWFPFFYVVIPFLFCCDFFFLLCCDFFFYYVALPFLLCCDLLFIMLQFPFHYAAFPLYQVAILFLSIPFLWCCDSLWIMMQSPFYYILFVFSLCCDSLYYALIPFSLCCYFPLCHEAILNFIMLQFPYRYAAFPF